MTFCSEQDNLCWIILGFIFFCQNDYDTTGSFFSSTFFGKTQYSHATIFLIFFLNFKIARLLYKFLLVKNEKSESFIFFQKYPALMAVFWASVDKKTQYSNAPFGQNLIKSRFFNFFYTFLMMFLQKIENAKFGAVRGPKDKYF